VSGLLTTATQHPFRPPGRAHGSQHIERLRKVRPRCVPRAPRAKATWASNLSRLYPLALVGTSQDSQRTRQYDQHSARRVRRVQNTHPTSARTFANWPELVAPSWGGRVRDRALAIMTVPAPVHAEMKANDPLSVVQRFADAFNRHYVSAVGALVTDNVISVDTAAHASSITPCVGKAAAVRVVGGSADSSIQVTLVETLQVTGDDVTMRTETRPVRAGTTCSGN
jgi:hypothetical protein